MGKNNPAQRGFLTGETELLLTRQESEDIWQGLVHPGRKVRTGEVLVFGDDELEAEILGRGEYGVRRARLRARTGTIEEALDRLGHVPLPPYIQRRDEAERPRHLSDRLRQSARGRGGADGGTAFYRAGSRARSPRAAWKPAKSRCTWDWELFSPCASKQIEDHHMEAERYEISEAAAAAINRALDERRRVIAVGTTSVRTLESVAREHGGRIAPGRGETRLFIIPGFPFRVIRGLLTNFHLPQSTLLMLVSAFAGKDFVLRAYRHAVEARYRFYSYGDCMLIL